MLAQEKEPFLMNKFSALLGGCKYDGRMLRVNGSKLGKVVVYFAKFPLKSKKMKDYQIWLEIYQLILAKEYRTEIGLQKILTLRLGLNADFKKARGIV
jgi:hypothetical protein